MKAVIISRAGNPEVLKIGEIETSEPASDEISVQVHATALNRADLLQRRGLHPATSGRAPGCSGPGVRRRGHRRGREGLSLQTGGPGDGSPSRGRLRGESGHARAYGYGNPGSSELRGGGIDS